MSNNAAYMKIDLLGQIYIKDTIIYYDKPLVFSCINNTEQLFIASCIDLEDEETWLFVPLSKGKLILGLTGSIPAYKLFTEPEDSFLWKVNISASKYDDGKAYRISPQILEEDDLPDKDIVYDLYDTNDFKIKDEELENIAKISIEERREILDISLEPENTHIHEIDVLSLAKTLEHTQNIINLIAHKRGVNAKMPKIIKEENKLVCAGNYAASFGIRLKSNGLSDIMNESKLQNSLTILMNLLAAKSNKEQLNNILKELNPAVGLHYKNFLKFLDREQISIKTYCAFPNTKYYNNYLTIKEIREGIKTLENDIKEMEQEKILMGRIVAIDTINKTFKFISNDEERISGVIGDNINIEEYILPKFASIKIKIRTKLDQFVEKENSSYELIGIRYDNDSFDE